MITGLLIGAGVTTVVMAIFNKKRENHNTFNKFLWSTGSNFVMSAVLLHSIFYLFSPGSMFTCIIAGIIAAFLFIYFNFI